MNILILSILIFGLIYSLREFIRHKNLYRENKRLKGIYIYLIIFWLLLLSSEIFHQKLLLLISPIFLIIHIYLRVSSRNQSLNELKEIMDTLDLDDSKQEDVIPYWHTPLTAAIEAGELEKVKELISSGADIEETASDYTPLMHAINNNNEDISMFLIEQGANIHAKESDLRDETADSPISLAVGSQMVNIVRLLLNNGADPTLFHPENYTLIDGALEQGNEEIVALLRKHGLTPTLIDDDE